ncbi:MAG: SoxR reducing system RseC family protein [candidate division KSB1 bacterium]|nr:SoxR reducing system RseC family protein [candidate division KSB1 bacterium]
MQEHGKIIKCDGREAVVEIEQGEQCKHCNACHMFGESKMRLTAHNGIDAQPGDHVTVVVEPRFVLTSSFLIFIFPILAMIAGYFVGQTFSQSPDERFGILGAFAGLLMALGFNRMVNRTASSGEHHNSAEIISRIRADQQDNTGQSIC